MNCASLRGEDGSVLLRLEVLRSPEMEGFEVAVYRQESVWIGQRTSPSEDVQHRAEPEWPWDEETAALIGQQAPRERKLPHPSCLAIAFGSSPTMFSDYRPLL